MKVVLDLHHAAGMLGIMSKKDPDNYTRCILFQHGYAFMTDGEYGLRVAPVSSELSPEDRRECRMEDLEIEVKTAKLKKKQLVELETQPTEWQHDSKRIFSSSAEYFGECVQHKPERFAVSLEVLKKFSWIGEVEMYQYMKALYFKSTCERIDFFIMKRRHQGEHEEFMNPV